MQGNSDAQLPFEEGFTRSSLSGSLVKILILAAQSVQNFQHEGKQSDLPFLGEASPETISGRTIFSELL